MTPPPAAFMSYVQADDHHERGQLTELRKRLEGEVQAKTGIREFSIFQDKDSLAGGDLWDSRIEDALRAASILIAVVTPSFLCSKACRSEVMNFLAYHPDVGVGATIIPVYYRETLKLDEPESPSDDVANVLRKFQWRDWTDLRGKSMATQRVRNSIGNIAEDIIGYLQTMNESQPPSIASAKNRHRPGSGTSMELPATNEESTSGLGEGKLLPFRRRVGAAIAGGMMQPANRQFLAAVAVSNCGRVQFGWAYACSREVLIGRSCVLIPNPARVP